MGFFELVLLIALIAVLFGGFYVNNLIFILIVLIVVLALFSYRGRTRGGPPVV